MTIRDKIIPHAVSWFTGEAAKGDEFDDINDDGDDEEEEDDDDEDEDDSKTSQTHFGPRSGTGSAVSADPDRGVAKLDPRIRVRIWILFLTTNLDPGSPGSGPDPTRCHPYLSSIVQY